MPKSYGVGPAQLHAKDGADHAATTAPTAQAPTTTRFIEHSDDDE